MTVLGPLPDHFLLRSFLSEVFNDPFHQTKKGETDKTVHNAYTCTFHKRILLFMHSCKQVLHNEVSSRHFQKTKWIQKKPPISKCFHLLWRMNSCPTLLLKFSTSLTKRNWSSVALCVLSGGISLIAKRLFGAKSHNLGSPMLLWKVNWIFASLLSTMQLRRTQKTSKAKFIFEMILLQRELDDFCINVCKKVWDFISVWWFTKCFATNIRKWILFIGGTPFHAAAQFGQVGICRLIIECVEDKNPASDHGNTPLHWAAQSGHSEICRLIIDNINHKNPTNNRGITPLHLAAQNGHLTACCLIMEEVCDKNPSDANGYTPLHLAAWYGHFDVCRLIVDQVAEKNPGNRRGNTALHWAAQNGHLDVCSLILQNVSEKNPPNQRADTPLHLAALNGRIEVCKLFLENVIDKFPLNDSGQTPLDNARECGLESIFQLFNSIWIKKLHTKRNKTNFYCNWNWFTYASNMQSCLLCKIKSLSARISTDCSVAALETHPTSSLTAQVNFPQSNSQPVLPLILDPLPTEGSTPFEEEGLEAADPPFHSYHLHQ